VSYRDSLAKEQQIYENCVDVHGLPPIFHYWTSHHLLPKVQAFGFKSPSDMFAQHLEKACHAGRPSRFVSLGSGNCDLEIDLARTLQRHGHDFILDCLDVNPAMLERGRLAAEQAGLSNRINFIASDLNSWQPDREYDAVVANQSLHHVVNLEALFDNVKRTLRPGGEFLISDMIGRNGHQRWPEALAVIHEFWSKLPPSYRYNQLLSCYEELYQSWDCSVEGFEGVRAQDILPLLIDRFHFHIFIPYGNVTDPFIDRAFGPHFDPASAWDRAFIDAVHRRDDAELASGRLTPTHMMAVLANEPISAPRFPAGLSPDRCVRAPDKIVQPSPQQKPYDWGAWPHDTQTELEIACQRLAQAAPEIRQRTLWAQDLQKLLDERTKWAVMLDKEMQERTAWGFGLDQHVSELIARVLALQADLEKCAALAPGMYQKVSALEQEVEERTLWALRLQQELAEQTSRAERLDRELFNLIHRPFYLARRVLSAIRNRLQSMLNSRRIRKE
jgi:SAM-dependent methyltransferase